MSLRRLPAEEVGSRLTRIEAGDYRAWVAVDAPAGVDAPGDDDVDDPTLPPG